MRRLAFASVLLAACGSDPEGTITLTVGEEADAFSRSPAPTTLIVERLAIDGSKSELARTGLPADSLVLGDLPRSDIGAFIVRAVDGGGKTLLAGESLFVQWGALELTTFEVFVQRTGELARMPRGPSPMEPTAVTTVTGRYVMMARDKTAMLYDLLALRTLDGQTTLPRTARSIAAYGTTLIVLDETGGSALDLQLSRSQDMTPPMGGAFGDVAGGVTVEALDGTAFIVGATRLSGGPTTRILRIGNDGNVTFANLGAAREGACATWVEGRGLVVYGGNPTAPGAELLGPDATAGVPLPVPPDAIRGCGIAPLDPGHVAVAGGGAAVRVFDLACASQCAPATWSGAIPLVRAEVHGLAPDAAFITGDAVDGSTHAYRVSPAEAREIALRVPRRGARLVILPTAAAALLGGGPGIESYRD